MKMVPVVFAWKEVADNETGEISLAMVPLRRYLQVASRQFAPGEEYPLVVLEARSRESHNQYFAAVADGFRNLPEDLTVIRDRLGIDIPPRGWVNEENLRKWCLCEVGLCDVEDLPCESEVDARRFAAWYRKHDRDYAKIERRGTHVTIKIAKSQSAAAMGKAEFEQSKKAVLDLIESMTGLSRGTLMKQAGRSA